MNARIGQKNKIFQCKNCKTTTCQFLKTIWKQKSNASRIFNSKFYFTVITKLFYELTLLIIKSKMQ